MKSDNMSKITIARFLGKVRKMDKSGKERNHEIHEKDEKKQ